MFTVQQLPYIQPQRGVTAQPAIDRLPTPRAKREVPSDYQWLGSKDPLELMCLMEDEGYQVFKRR